MSCYSVAIMWVVCLFGMIYNTSTNQSPDVFIVGQLILITIGAAVGDNKQHITRSKS